MGEEGSAGEVCVRINVFTHPGTGEHEITVKGWICFFILQSKISFLKNYIGN